MNTLRQLEQDVLAEGREWMRQRLEKRLRDHSDAVLAVCPKSGEGLKDARWRDLQLITVSGVVKLRVRHGYSPALGQWVCPARHLWGLRAYQRLSPELESRLAYTASATGSYEAAGQMATRWGTPVSDGCIHQHMQSLGEIAEQIELPPAVMPPQEPEFSLVIMLDGWLARERGPDWGAGPRKKDPQRILWHEIKSAVIYRLERRAASDSGRGMLIEKFVLPGHEKSRCSKGERCRRIAWQATPAALERLWPDLGQTRLHAPAQGRSVGEKPRRPPPVELTPTDKVRMHRCTSGPVLK
ncbi:MAG: hypothetical protein ACREIC_11100, partial [Limisphaerales bacterium]